jgi:hypothetical protein
MNVRLRRQGNGRCAIGPLARRGVFRSIGGARLSRTPFANASVRIDKISVEDDAVGGEIFLCCYAGCGNRRPAAALARLVVKPAQAAE